MSKVSVFGGYGFIGGRYSDMYSDQVIRIHRDHHEPSTKDILYFISTIDNYHIHDNIHIDVDTNLTVLLNVLDNVKKNYTEKDKPTINFISSWFVYGKNNNIPFSEDSYCNPTGFYSITKRCAEQLLICFCETFGYNYRIIRLANVIGEGDTKISKKKNALQFFVKEIVRNRDVDLYYGGDVYRDYIYVDDVCRAINLILQKGELNTIYNIGSGKPYKFLDMINFAIDYAKSKSKINDIPATRFHNIVQVRNSYLDVQKLKSLGFEPKYDINSAIMQLVDFYKRTNK